MSRFFTPMLGVAGAAVVALSAMPPAQAQQNNVIDAAFQVAVRTFERALPQLNAVTMGVPTRDYHEAMTQRRFRSSQWGALDVQVVTNDSEHGLCAGFAAYVTPDIEQGAMSLVICPQFFSPGADELRETTILHEMVHVVVGPDECQAMALMARVQMLATGTFQPVAQYWKTNHCDGSRYRLPD